VQAIAIVDILFKMKEIFEPSSSSGTHWIRFDAKDNIKPFCGLEIEGN
jgi:hypothetical protein